MATKTTKRTAPTIPADDHAQKLLDARLDRLAATADAAGWDDFAAALRARIGRPPARAWAKDLAKALGAYDPKQPQADKAARAAWLFASRFGEADPNEDPDRLLRRLHTDAYWTARHLAAAGIDGLAVAAAPAPAEKAAADKPAAPKAKRAPAAKRTTRTAKAGK